MEVICLFLIIILLIILLLLYINSPSTEERCSEGPNFEKMFIEKTKNQEFLSELLQNPRKVLEEELELFLNHEFRLPDDVNVKVIQENPKDLYLLIPSRKESPETSPLELILDSLQEKETYGLFMGDLEDMWWRLGIHEGSCMSDIRAEIREVKARRCLYCP